MKKKLVIWIFQTGEPLHIDDSDSRPMRAMNLTNSLINSGHQVVLWSSDFYHQKKQHRFRSNKKIKVSKKLEIRLLKSIGYKKNIGLGRIIDHCQLAYSLRKELKNVDHTPDVAFIGYPPIEAAAVFSSWLSKRSIPILLDIKDQWPTLFIDKLPRFTKGFGSIIFWPYFYLAKKVISDSIAITTMSSGYINWVKNFHGEDNKKLYNVFPLTSPLNIATKSEIIDANNWWNELGIQNDNSSKVCFVGSLSQAFEFKPIQRAAILASSKQIDIKFIICGEGNDSEKIKGMFENLPGVIFPGWINRAQIEVLAEMCIGSLAPYKNIDNFTANIPNKIVDSISLKLPIISPLKGEVKKLIDDYKIGLSYNESSGEDLLELILKLKSDKALQKNLSENALKLYKTNFSYEMVYDNLVHHIETIAQKN
jgi:glycosyltransferase involved in cell wall biosynthesis